MKKIFLFIVVFITLIGFASCTEEIADQAEDVAPSPTVSKKPDIIQYAVPQQTQNTRTEQVREPQTQQTSETQEAASYPTIDLPKSIELLVLLEIKPYLQIDRSCGDEIWRISRRIVR